MKMSIFNKVNRYAPLNDIEFQNIFQGITPRWLEGIDYDTLNNEVFVDMLEVIPSSRVNNVLNRLFNNPQTMALSRDRLYEKVQERYLGISRPMVMDFLKNQETWQLRKRVPKVKTTRPIVANNPREIWAMDLIDMQKYSRWNRGMKYILTIIDIFSKKLFTFPIPEKTGDQVSQKLDQLFAQEKPDKMMSDRGPEFVNQDVENIMRRYNVKQILTRQYTPQSNGNIERVNGTIKNYIFQAMVQNRTNDWTTNLPMYVWNYNDSIHSTTKFRPELLHTMNNQNMINDARRRILKIAKGRVKNVQRFRVGDRVRIVNAKLPENINNSMFRSRENYSQQIFEIADVIHDRTRPWAHPVYIINVNGVRMNFSPYELLKVDINTLVTRPILNPPPQQPRPQPPVQQIPQYTPNNPRRSARINPQNNNNN